MRSPTVYGKKICGAATDSRIKKHSSSDNVEVYNNILLCEQFNYINTVMKLTPQ
jgi:hypothetical protein